MKKNNMLCRKTICVILIVIALTGVSLFAETMTFNVVTNPTGVESLSIHEQNPDYPYGIYGYQNIEIGTEYNLSKRRMLLRFDVSALEGLYASIDSVKLYLRYSDNTLDPLPTTDFMISIGQIAADNADWELLTTTWNNKKDDGESTVVPWLGQPGLFESGVDYNVPVAGSFMFDHVIQNTKLRTELYIPLRTSVVVDWTVNPSNNGGLILFGGEDIPNNISQFYGYNNGASGPALIVEYTPLPDTCQELWDMGLGNPVDINKDCKVDFTDFAEFAESWLLCYDPEGGCQ